MCSLCEEIKINSRRPNAIAKDAQNHEASKTRRNLHAAQRVKATRSLHAVSEHCKQHLPLIATGLSMDPVLQLLLVYNSYAFAISMRWGFVPMHPHHPFHQQRVFCTPAAHHSLQKPCTIRCIICRLPSDQLEHGSHSLLLREQVSD